MEAVFTFEEGKYFHLTADTNGSKRGIYLVDSILHNHYADWGHLGKSPTSCTWIIARNVEDNSICQFAIGSSVSGWCSPTIRDYNLDKLLCTTTKDQ